MPVLSEYSIRLDLRADAESSHQAVKPETVVCSTMTIKSTLSPRALHGAATGRGEVSWGFVKGFF